MQTQMFLLIQVLRGIQTFITETAGVEYVSGVFVYLTDFNNWSLG